MTREFGWLSHAARYATHHLTVEPLPAFQENIASIQKHSRLAGKWLYPPLVRNSSNPKCLVYDVRFELPCTHQLTLRRPFQNGEFATTTIALIGMLHGVRLVPDGFGHLNRVPIKPHAFGDLHCSRKEVEYILGRLEDFWVGHPTLQCRRQLYAALHSHVYAQSYLQEFELFSAHYQTLEAIRKLHELTKGPLTRFHAEFPGKLARRHNLRVPGWASVRKGKGSAKPSCQLSRIRNELVHEARWAKRPIGHALLPGHGCLDLELSNFNARLLLAILGVKAGYIRSRVDQRQIHLLN